jgi:hypothetical protein
VSASRCNTVSCDGRSFGLGGAGETKRPVPSMDAQHQRADAGLCTLHAGEPADHELLAQQAFELYPVGGPARAIASIRSFADDFFQLHLARGSNHRRGVNRKIFGEANQRARNILHNFTQEGTPRAQRLVANIGSAQPQEVEHKQNNVGNTAMAEGVLQRIEVWLPTRIEHVRFD